MTGGARLAAGLMPVIGDSHGRVTALMRRRQTGSLGPSMFPFPRAYIFSSRDAFHSRFAHRLQFAGKLFAAPIYIRAAASTYAFSANVRLLGDGPGRGLQLKLIWLTF